MFSCLFSLSQSVITCKGSGVIGQNVCSTRAGKADRTERYKEWLNDADLIFAVPSFNLTVKEVYDLRKVMPEGTKVRPRNRSRSIVLL